MTRPFYSLDHYAKRLDRVLEYIDANLAVPLRLSMLATQASFSPCHFHHIFCAWQGETPQSYIRRCRLERSAALLHYGPGTAIMDIAPQCGFTSVEAFDRAFHAYFGMTPSKWRNGGYAHWQAAAESLSPSALNLSSKQVELKHLPPAHTVYKRKVGPYQDGEAALWEQLAVLIGSFGLEAQPCFGVGLDDPAVTPAARCRFDACAELPQAAAIPANTPIKLLHGGLHAVLAYHGPAGSAQPHWRWLLQDWLPHSGYKVSQNACFERYAKGAPTTGVVQSELCLPLLR